ncbi:MAG: extracellular solute-binding protein [Devosia sp.]|uniref:extracellular solute-binding protein n=1 Tax=Devosia sp. TaxID=1871048 RepID=UPI001AD06B36|nr:extracellular solute-binding protein [Devosia sp.]MBN9317493.1 extracellular solute-binding protein [Devosia sp.]
MTWSHPRGYDPMVATAKAWAEKTGVLIEWDKRSLQDFESFPVEELARQYDLIVIDHPHVGQVVSEGCLAPLDVPGREAEREALARGSVGRSYPSYTYAGHQWALPIDAATQVMAFRADLVEAPKDWDGVVALARAGHVTLPLLAPHSMMSFFTLTANMGHPCSVENGPLVDAAAGIRAIEMIAEVAAHIEPSNFAMDPIAASEAMARNDAKVALMPLGYGYVSYAVAGFRPHQLTFANIPLPGAKGSALGGTGIAVSAFSQHREAAIDYAYWVASAEVQKSLYALSGGQPGHAAAWEDDAVNAAAGNFYRDTRKTLEGAHVRPRHHGYMAFQDAASKRLNAGMINREPAAAILADIDRMFRESF